jgi:hypothetical protein
MTIMKLKQFRSFFLCVLPANKQVQHPTAATEKKKAIYYIPNGQVNKQAVNFGHYTLLGMHKYQVIWSPSQLDFAQWCLIFSV